MHVRYCDFTEKTLQNAHERFLFQLTGFDRGRILLEAARLIRENVEDLARNEVLDNGKPIWEARMDLDTVIGSLEFYGGVAPSIFGQHAKLPNGSFAIVSKDPLGVVGGVGAWNYPLQTATWKIAPALACGNTFIYKPSPLTPLNVVLLAEVMIKGFFFLNLFATVIF